MFSDLRKTSSASFLSLWFSQGLVVQSTTMIEILRLSIVARICASQVDLLHDLTISG